MVAVTRSMMRQTHRMDRRQHSAVVPEECVAHVVITKDCVAGAEPRMSVYARQKIRQLRARPWGDGNIGRMGG